MSTQPARSPYRMSFAPIALALLAPTAASQMRTGDVLVNLFGENGISRVDHFRPDGTFVGTTSGGSGEFWLGATLTPSGHLATTRREPRGVNLFDVNGSEVGTFDVPEVNAVADLSVFSDGTIAVIDQWGEVALYSEAGEYEQSFNAPEMSNAWGSFIDRNDELWVANLAGSDVWRFDRDGVLLDSFETAFRPGDIVAARDGTLWSIDHDSGAVHHLDRNGTPLGDFPTIFGSQSDGLGLSPDGTVYVMSQGLYVVARYTTDGQYLGQFSLDPQGSPVFLSIVDSLALPPTPYCTAKTNSLGCAPRIGADGVASASGDSGFVVNAFDVRNQKPGFLMYTLAGRAAIPFQGGVLCLAKPIQRTPARSSEGHLAVIQDCSGVYRIDMNAFGAGSTGGEPRAELRLPGTLVHCQWYARDPGAIAGSSLSDALEYEVGL